MESSSRYCNFSGDRFGREITICVPNWVIKEAEQNVKPIGFRHIEGIDALNECNKGLAQYCYEVGNGYDVTNMNIIDYWLFANLACEHSYMNMIRLGAKAEEAREVLPLDLKTELYHTAFLDDWLHFCSLRAWKSQGNNPHPEARRLGIAVFEGLKYLGFVTDDFRKDREIQ
jgi:thymidylate synthase (FAD)